MKSRPWQFPLSALFGWTGMTAFVAAACRGYCGPALQFVTISVAVAIAVWIAIILIVGSPIVLICCCQQLISLCAWFAKRLGRHVKSIRATFDVQ